MTKKLICAYVTFNGQAIKRFTTEEEARQFITEKRNSGQQDGQYAIDVFEEDDLA